MSSQNRSDRLQAFFERENALHDEIMKGRPTWWHVGKVVIGVACVTRSVSFALGAAGLGGYALALLLFAGGAYLTYEGLSTLRQRTLDARRS